MVGASPREAQRQPADTQETERLALLAAASHLLADAGLELPVVLERLCELLIPRLGHACHVRLLSEDGQWLNSVASAHADPQVRAYMQRLTSAPQRADEGPLALALRTGRAVLLTQPELAQLQRQMPPGLHPPVPTPSTTHLILVPLRARQRPLGVLALYRGQGGAPFEPTEQLLVQELADRAGLALDLARAYEAERRARHAAEVAAERLSRLQRVTQALSEAVTPADVARVIIEEVLTTIGAQQGLLVLPQPGHPELLEVTSNKDFPPELLEPFSPFSATSALPLAVAYRTGEPLWLESHEALLTRFPLLQDQAPRLPQAVACLPLRARQRTLGAIGFGFSTPRPFSPEERDLLLDLARQSAQALERAHLYEAEQHARARAERVAARTARLQAVTTALSQVLTASRVAEVVIDQGVAALGAKAGGLWLVNEAGTHARRLRSVGMEPEFLELFDSVPLVPDSPQEAVILRGQPVWLESREELARRYPLLDAALHGRVTDPGLSVACLPLMVDGHSRGALVFAFPRDHRFDDDERVFLALLAHHAALALERARLFEQERSAREALRDAHHTLEAIIQSSPMAIILLELDGTVRLWNPAAERIFGWKATEVFGRFMPSVPEDKREEFHGNLARVARGESLLGMETLRQRRDGTTLAVSLWSTAVRVAGEHPLCLTVSADITGRKRAEEDRRFLSEASTLLASSLEHEVTLERVAHLAVPTYAEGCYVYLLGQDGTVSCVATASADTQRTPPRELGPLAPGESAVSRVIHSGLPELCADRSALPAPAEGSELPCEQEANSYLCVPLLVRGQTLGALSFVSSLRRYGPLDLALAQELARRASLAIDNARLYREARDAIRLREEFLSIASHELRTPITTLQLQVQSLLAALARGPACLAPERLRRGLETVDRQVKRQTQLVNDLLDVSRLGAGRLELKPEPVELATLVREVAERFEQEAERTGSRLELRTPAPVPGQWDRMRLDQVVTNLVANAVKYGRGNPILLSVEEAAGRARLVVSDAGIGIAPEKLPRVFDRFERAVSERHYGGFGLGLWIARQIVQAMGGHITVASELGVGSTFTVELPVEPP